MIEVAISYGFGSENRYNLPQIPENIQLALYKVELYQKYRQELIASVKDSGTKVSVIHLPIDGLRLDPEVMIEIMQMGLAEFGCTHYVIHPNKGIQKFLSNFIMSKLNVKLCVENFQWRTNKVFRSPLNIIEATMNFDNLSMTFDTSHADEVWFDHRVLPFLLKHTSVIHLSNRAKGHGDHMPFNSPNGSLNLMKFVHDINRYYKWNGTIVLEYMEKYQDKILKNADYLRKMLR